MDTTEYIDTKPEISTKVQKLADILVSSKKTICFTGAGISTSTGIPDYRSGYQTILATGPGAWETEENKLKHLKEKVLVELRKAIPSKTHMALSELVSRGLLSYITTQNVDGLHRKSGVPEHKLTELHGSGIKEICKSCHWEYLRDYEVRNRANKTDFKTLRNCTNCGESLYTSVVLFGYPIRMIDKSNAVREVESSDFCLVLGSSLRVPPASRYPKKFINNPNKKLAIVNLQKTYLDEQCDVRIGSLCDDAIELLMEKLGIPIPEFKVKRWFSFQVTQDLEYSTLKIKNYNQDMREFSAIKEVEVDLHAEKSLDYVDLEGDTLEYKFNP